MYEVAHLDEIDELDDGRVPMCPVRHHLGITALGVNAFTGREAGDRIINEHDEADAGEAHGVRGGAGDLFYNLACVESLTGRKAEAIDHLRRAIELSEQTREFAKGDSDLDAIRDEPEFKELIGA